jgi:hypothetical protein
VNLKKLDLTNQDELTGTIPTEMYVRVCWRRLTFHLRLNRLRELFLAAQRSTTAVNWALSSFKHGQRHHTDGTVSTSVIVEPVCVFLTNRLDFRFKLSLLEGLDLGATNLRDTIPTQL